MKDEEKYSEGFKAFWKKCKECDEKRWAKWDALPEEEKKRRREEFEKKYDKGFIERVGGPLY